MLQKITTLLLLVFIAVAAKAQTYEYKAKEAVPMDQKVIMGKLENGLTYYVITNKFPEKRAEFYLVNNVGSMQETPGQNGFAHLTEHMCFNGTKNFEKKEIIHYLESIGMKFGPEINAYTIYDETVYTLNKVPIEQSANIDTSLMILYDWASNVSMETSEIDAERQVVREELRTRMSAMSRMRDDVNKVLFEGSKYAVHNVIGTVEVIEKSPADTLRAYYNEWYRPDLQAIIAVGDFDAKDIEARIKTMFGKLEKHKNAKERLYYPIPDHTNIKAIVTKDKESPYAFTQVVYKKNPSNVKDQNEYRDGHIDGLISIMVNNRLAEKTLAPNPPFMQAFAYYTDLVRTKDAYFCMGVSSADKIVTTYQSLLEENERIKRYGFLETELDRAKKELLSGNEKAYNERNKKESEDVAQKLMANFLTQEAVPGDEWDIAFVRDIMKNITLDEVNAMAKSWITDENLVIAIMAPDKEGVVLPTEAELIAMATAVHGKEVAQYVDASANKPLISKVPTPGTIVKEEVDAKNGITRWTLNNGVKVVMKPTNFKDDEIQLSAYSLGGWSTLSQKDDVSGKIAAEVVDLSGVGEFNAIELQKALSGKVASLSPFIGELTEGFNGNSSVADFSTMLQLNYLYFTAARADKDAFENYKQRTATSLANKNADPRQTFIDSMRWIMSQYHPRKRNMSVEMLDEANLNRIKFIFSERFGDPGSFTYYLVGNIDPQLQKDTILKYLGGLPMVNRTEIWKDLGIRAPESKVIKHFERPMETEKTTVFVAFTGLAKKYTIEDRLNLEMISEYLDVRFFETLREDQGGTYGAGVWNSFKHYPTPEYSVSVFFDAKPEKADTMVKIVYNELVKLMNEPLDEKIIKNTAENKIKEYHESIKSNRYWLGVIKNDDFDAEDMKNFDYEGYWKNMNAKQLQKAAKKLLKSEKAVEVVQTTKK